MIGLGLGLVSVAFLDRRQSLIQCKHALAESNLVLPFSATQTQTSQ